MSGSQRLPVVIGDGGKQEELQSGDYLKKDEGNFKKTADEDIDALEVLRSSATGLALADASSTGAADSTIGFATELALLGNPVNCQTNGVLAGFVGLTEGATYFLDTTAGAMVTTPPTASGQVIVQLGIAISTTEFEIRIQQRIKRG